ncbi:FAD-dependent oxidoreductase [Phenylobacterium sp.]|uniref:FAD-dependent oxidoreductase n=1 Tax=Phenylobacterium sp. TaxID=1871053 RepID=UPI0025F7A5D0|nr:GMC family oxidoreductase [Phenylobacterium sp.]MBX3482606.1 GMC family oxidoreductase [Phenylobacterium sp.]MCW5760050.1 GMC family oxidoreductase [Phenylobacterium sp.]
MHLDLHTAESDVTLTTEVCVVGCGVAGITTARRLLELGRSVVLLESGGLDYEPATAALNAGDNIGEDYYALEDARLRFFGGTTAIWGGRLAELDPIDLEARPWVPHSGWPMAWAELSAWYAPARARFGMPGTAAEAADLIAAGVRPPAFDPAALSLGVWTFDRKFNRFVFAECHDLIGHPRCRIVTHATVTEIGLDPDGRRVSRLSVRALNGRALDVQARTVVLAAGGLENPRLLLASRSVMADGVGNGRDQVGRYFMEHPHARGGRVTGPAAFLLLDAFGRGRRLGELELAGLIKPSAQLQAERGILNTSLTIAARQPAQAAQNWGMAAYSSVKHTLAPTKQGRALWMATKSAAKWAQRRTDPARPWLLHKLGLRDIALLIRAEQAPNPESRVLLTDRTDPLGVPRLALDWRMTDLDVTSAAVLVETLGAELRRLGLGRVEPAEWLTEAGGGWRTDPLISAHPIGGYHHMGTTRMSADPRSGVVDATGRIHGLENLYVVGSSVFPTSSWANPTLTIAALALRTAEYAAETAQAARAA